MGFGLLWIPLMQLISGQLYTYLQSVQAYIAPPIAAVFLIGVSWQRVNATGAMASLLTGFVLGMGRLLLELNKGRLDGLLFTYADINFLHFAVVLFVICTAVLVIVSLLTPPPPVRKVAELTFATTTAPTPDAATEDRRRVDLALSVLLIACVAGLWIYFAN